MKPLALALPSKGRLTETTQSLLSRAGLELARSGAARGYRGELSGIEGIDVLFLSAGEIAENLLAGSIDLGVTGEDLLRETLPDNCSSVDIALRLGFGPADVAVAVPECWLDVASMADLDEISARFHAEHGRRLRVADAAGGDSLVGLPVRALRARVLMREPATVERTALFEAS